MYSDLFDTRDLSLRRVLLIGPGEIQPESAPPPQADCGVVQQVGGWGEASLQGQSTPTGRSFRPVRACVRAVLFMSNQG